MCCIVNNTTDCFCKKAMVTSEVILETRRQAVND